MRAAVQVPVRRLWHRLKDDLGARPGVYLPFAARRYGRHLVLGPHTEIVIEGFPRSANTFAVMAFRFAQERHVAIAHHLHAPAQVIAGLDAGLPVVVLIRRPRDAIVSLAIRDPYLTLEGCARSYLKFYRRIASFRNRFTVATFDQVISDFGLVIRRLNGRFGTQYHEFIATPANVERVFESIDAVHRGRRAARRPEDLRTFSGYLAKMEARRPKKELLLRRYYEEIPPELNVALERVYRDFTEQPS